MKISKITHKEKDRIMLQFSFDREKINLVKQIEGATWSQTLKAWHIPYTIESYQKMVNLFPETDGSIPEFSNPGPKPGPKKGETVVKRSNTKDINIEVFGRKIVVASADLQSALIDKGFVIPEKHESIYYYGNSK